jgi:pyruvate-ferredoxin/flavodoxin oxidoreductase
MFDVKGSQFRQPLLEFSGSCAGCAETSYARLVTQLFGEHMIYLQRHRLLVHLGRPRRHSPYTVKEGRGPAWANSLFEDNAEHGLGMYLGQKASLAAEAHQSSPPGSYLRRRTSRPPAEVARHLRRRQAPIRPLPRSL